MIEDKEFEIVSQSAHVFSGWAIALTGLHYHQVWVPIAFVAYSAVKEFWYDQNYETQEVRGSNLLDFCMSTLGAVIGTVVYYL